MMERKKRWSREKKKKIKENIKARKWIREERRRENTNWLLLGWHISKPRRTKRVSCLGKWTL